MNKFEDLTLLELKAKREYYKDCVKMAYNKYKDVVMSMEEVDKVIEERLSGDRQ